MKFISLNLRKLKRECNVTKLDTRDNTKIVSFADNSSYDRNSDKSVRKNTPGIFLKKKKKTIKKSKKKSA